MKKSLQIKLAIGVILISFACSANSQVITTVAGNGTNSFSGDGGQATSAEFSGANDVAFDNSGNMYIADQNNNRIREINTSGVINTIAGNASASYYGDGGPATAAEFDGPTAIALDQSGDLFIADYNNHRLREINTSQTINLIAGTGVNGYSGDGGQATAADLNYPASVLVDDTGNVYFADSHNDLIRKINTSGVVSSFAGNGNAGFSGDGGDANSAELDLPYRIAFDTNWNMYIADSHNSRIRKVDAITHVITTVAGNGTASYGGDGGQATAAQINQPFGVCVDKFGDIYIADTYNNRIRMVNKLGVIVTIAGNGTGAYSGDGGPATAAEINYPTNIKINRGDLYLADYSNYRIRKIALALGTEQISDMGGINIYPNPVKDKLIVQVDNSANIEKIELYTITGEKILEKTCSQSSMASINCEFLSNGVYIAKVLLQHGAPIVKKVEVVR